MSTEEKQLLCIGKGTCVGPVEFRTKAVDNAGTARYRVSGFGLCDLLGADMETLNEMTCDEVVAGGYHLSDIRFELVGPVEADGTVSIKVTADATEWLQEVEVTA